MDTIHLPIFWPIYMDGSFAYDTPSPSSSPMECTECGRVQQIDWRRIWNRGKCYACGGSLLNLRTK